MKNRGITGRAILVGRGNLNGMDSIATKGRIGHSQGNMKVKGLKMLRFLFVFVIGFGGLYELEARHIIGGDITYECLGEGRFEFTLHIYRDCNCVDCAMLDDFASIGVYECSGRNCSSLRQGQTVRQLLVPLDDIQSIAKPDYPCLIPPDLCVEEGIYRFTLNLPPSEDSYHISYQRCCRNRDINNIPDPTSFGATYTIELTPEAYALCNNSPTFKSFPPTVICEGASLNFDHSAIDTEGDSLVYSFCKPLDGGGNITQSPELLTCFGAKPTPSCPPPYDSVGFLLNLYSTEFPMGGEPKVRINPETGEITGTPNRKGKYVVGVCVEEYRGDTLLSKVFRDFQFNVADCDPTVVADIEADAVIDGQEYFINACGAIDVTIPNKSYDRSFVDFVEWRFDINGEQQISTDWSPTISFPGIGQYQGVLILNPRTECGDTATVTINVLPSINADFEFAYDTCIAGPVNFTDLSETGSNFMTGWNWTFGDGGRSSVPSPSYRYRTPENWEVTLTVRDTNQCVDAITKTIPYFPIPALQIESPTDFLGCQPGTITFNNLSEPISEAYTINWDFGDGGMSDALSPTYTYENVGIFSVELSVVSPIGCKTDTLFPDLVVIKPAPIADFIFAPEEPSNIEPEVFFTDRSVDAIAWEWSFGPFGSSNQPNPSFTFRDTGRYEVVQEVIHPSGCRDTITKIVDVKPEVRYFLPNAFTPNADSKNDTYQGVGIMIGAQDFTLNIWNRWGELVFTTNDPNQGWNGRKFNRGEEVPNGVYVAIANFRTPRGEPVEIKGFATVIR